MTAADHGSLYNTPACFTMFVLISILALRCVAFCRRLKTFIVLVYHCLAALWDWSYMGMSLYGLASFLCRMKVELAFMGRDARRTVPKGIAMAWAGASGPLAVLLAGLLLCPLSRLILVFLLLECCIVLPSSCVWA